MTVPYESGVDFGTPRAGGESYIEYPFLELGDEVTKVYHMMCTVPRVDYDATNVSLDATMASAANADVVVLPFTADAAAYFVGDFEHASEDGVMVSFDRVFANIPAARPDEFTGTQAYTYPGMDTGGNTDGTDRTVTATSATSTITTLICTNTVSVGDVVYVVMAWTGAIGVNFNGYRTALTGTTGSAVNVSKIAAGTTFVSGTLTELDFQPRGQKPELTGSITDFTYYLPGVTGGITTFDDVTETVTFAPFNPNSFEATVTLSVTTIPSFAAYQAQIDNGDYIVIDSKISRWKGNIIVKRDLKIRAL